MALDAGDPLAAGVAAGPVVALLALEAAVALVAVRPAFAPGPLLRRPLDAGLLRGLLGGRALVAPVAGDTLGAARAGLVVAAVSLRALQPRQSRVALRRRTRLVAAEDEGLVTWRHYTQFTATYGVAERSLVAGRSLDALKARQPLQREKR